MRHVEFFYRDLSLSQSAQDFGFIRAFQPQLNGLFDHRFGMFRGFALAYDSTTSNERRMAGDESPMTNNK
jgi:hypothetical protein